jgi:hypothetical protein
MGLFRAEGDAQRARGAFGIRPVRLREISRQPPRHPPAGGQPVVEFGPDRLRLRVFRQAFGIGFE